MGPNGDGRHKPPIGPEHAHLGHPGEETPGEGPGPSVPTVRTGTVDDADTAARLHADRITEGFLSLLGARFLRRLYRRVSLVPDSFLLVAECDGLTVGFLAGSNDVPGLYRSFLWRDGAIAALLAAGPLVMGWRRVLETLHHGSAAPDEGGRGAELLSVAVDRAWSGRGAGQALVASFLGEVRSRGGTAAHVVVGAENGRAVALYERAGFAVSRHFELHPGTESLVMLWDGGRPDPGPP
jgi:ribosomal protein S18 acetylase RimI-like enzyme